MNIKPFDMAKAMARRLAASGLVQTEVPSESFFITSFSGYFAPEHELASEILQQALVKIGSTEKDTHVHVPDRWIAPEDLVGATVITSLEQVPLQQLLQAIKEIQAEQAKQQRQ
jgi:hypothetical protein